jgi:hypothetical protein
VRATKLHGPINSYIELKLQEHNVATAPTRRRRNREQLPEQPPRLFIREGGLTAKDWATINKYITLLGLFAEATRCLKDAADEVAIALSRRFLSLSNGCLTSLKLRKINYNNPDAPKDHLITNVNFAHTKIAEYYARFDDAPVYYAATILHPHYKHPLEALWKVLDTYNEAQDGPYYRAS